MGSAEQSALRPGRSSTWWSCWRSTFAFRHFQREKQLSRPKRPASRHGAARRRTKAKGRDAEVSRRSRRLLTAEASPQGPHGRPHSGQPRGIPLVAAPPYLPSPLPGASRPPRARGEQRTARRRRGDPRCPPEAAASRLWAAPPRGFSTRRRPPLRRRLRVAAAAVVVAAVPRPPRCRSAPAGCAAPRPPLSSSCRATSSATAPSRRPPGRGEKRLNAAQRPPVPPRPVPLRLFRKRKRRGGRAQAPRRHLGALRSGRHVGGAAAMLGDEGRPPRRPRRGGEGKASVAILTRPPR